MIIVLEHDSGDWYVFGFGLFIPPGELVLGDLHHFDVHLGIAAPEVGQEFKAVFAPQRFHQPAEVAIDAKGAKQSAKPRASVVLRVAGHRRVSGRPAGPSCRSKISDMGNISNPVFGSAIRDADMKVRRLKGGFGWR